MFSRINVGSTQFFLAFLKRAGNNVATPKRSNINLDTGTNKKKRM
jgi:hypothetical protein